MVAHEDEGTRSSSEEILLVKPENDDRAQDKNERLLGNLLYSTFMSVSRTPCMKDAPRYKSDTDVFEHQSVAFDRGIQHQAKMHHLYRAIPR